MKARAALNDSPALTAAADAEARKAAAESFFGDIAPYHT
jgi:hypothetical protein